MSCETVFERFSEQGELRLPHKTVSFGGVAWKKHPTFAGVELKTLVSGKETGGAVSCHLVRIAPHKSIGTHIHAHHVETHEVIEGDGICMNNGGALAYASGVISIFPMGVPHEVQADSDGLCLFAKFVPALD